MWPIEEWGKGQGHPYGVPDPATAQVYYGRGFVQLTWKSNYATMGHLLGIDLVGHPEKALELPIATQILFEGMMRAKSRIGDFTGLALDDCFNATHEDWVRARAIVNGTDHAAAITDIARTTMRPSCRPGSASKGWRRDAAGLARQLALAVASHRCRGRPGMGRHRACSAGFARTRYGGGRARPAAGRPESQG
jgi:Chitinase class I